MADLDISFDDPKQVEATLKELNAEVETIKTASAEITKKYENLKTAITSDLTSVKADSPLGKSLGEHGITIPEAPKPIPIDPEVKANIDTAKRTLVKELQASFAIIQPELEAQKRYAARLTEMKLPDLANEMDNPYRVAAENLAKTKETRPTMNFNGSASNSGGGTSLEDLLK